MGIQVTPLSSKTSLADALFAATRQRLIGLLFGQAGRSFYATELIGLTRSGSGAVQRELASLAQSGLVTVRAIGNQKHYQANPDSPIFEEQRHAFISVRGFALSENEGALASGCKLSLWQPILRHRALQSIRAVMN